MAERDLSDLLVPANASLKSALGEISKGLLQRSASAVEAQAIREIREQLKELEDEKIVDIYTFLEHDDYLGLKGLYPWIKWVLGVFYYPTEHYDHTVYRWKNKRIKFPGFKDLGYSKEDVELMKFDELVMIIGQRTGKSWAAAAVTLYELYKLLCKDEPTEGFDGVAPGSPMWLSVGATSQLQSQGTVWHYVTGWFNSSPWFRRYSDKASRLILPDGTPSFTQSSLRIDFHHKNIHMDCVHSRSGGLRGFTRYAIALDEISHFDEGDKRSAEAMYDAMTASTKTFKDNAVKVSFSSPLHVADMGMRLIASCGVRFSWEGYEDLGFDYLTEFDGRELGDPNPRMLGFHYPTWMLNPEIGFDDFEYDFRTKPEATWRDFGALPAQAEEAFFSDAAAVRQAFNRTKPCPINDKGQIADWFGPDYRISNYHLHVDVGAGKPSNFGIALGHPVVYHENGVKKHKVVIDLAYSVKANANGEMNFKKAREIIDAIINKFPIACYSSDGWNDLEYMQKIRNRVGRVETIVVDKIHYDELKTAIYEGSFECHASPQAEEELKRLGIKNGQKIVKGVGYTKDLADCLAAVCFRCRLKSFVKHVNGFATMGVFGGSSYQPFSSVGY